MYICMYVWMYDGSLCTAKIENIHYTYTHCIDQKPPWMTAYNLHQLCVALWNVKYLILCTLGAILSVKHDNVFHRRTSWWPWVAGHPCLPQCRSPWGGSLSPPRYHWVHGCWSSQISVEKLMMQTTTSDTHTYTRTHVCNMHNVPTQFACIQYLGNKLPWLHSKYRV